MARRKKQVINKELSDFKKRLGRFPTAPPVKVYKDKKQYNRCMKYKKRPADECQCASIRKANH